MLWVRVGQKVYLSILNIAQNQSFAQNEVEVKYFALILYPYSFFFFKTPQNAQITIIAVFLQQQTICL